MFRITALSLADDIEALKLEGKVAGAAVHELRRVVEASRTRSMRVGLDLSEVTFADEDGIECLRALARGGIEILATSGLVRELLRDGR